MIYLGSKKRLSKDILPVILKDRKTNQAYVEPFCGGCNLIDKVDGIRYANDYNKYLITLLKYVQNGGIVKQRSYENRLAIKEDYKNNTGIYTDLEIAETGFLGCFSGLWMSGVIKSIKPNERQYHKEMVSNVNNQAPHFKNIIFSNESYDCMYIPENSIIYCDPPYRNTIGYKDAINYDDFYEWCRLMKSKGHTVFVSEYSMPSDFECIFEKEIQNKLNNTKVIEKIFII